MEFTNEIYFDPTPKLKSSPAPILFLSFNNEKLRCNNCGNKYSATNLYRQKYCKQCLLTYIKSIEDDNIYFDVNIITNHTPRIKHKSTRNTNFLTKNIQEWCKNCLEISYFMNYYDHINTTTQYIFIEKDCKLCGKLIDKISFGFKICSNCYLISSGRVKSTLFDKMIPILYLPWWDTSNKSRVCNHNLKFLTNCQKWCSYCFIVYVRCRYCLTINIIFGITDQTQCKKCKRISNINIDITNISSGNHNIDEFLIFTRTNIDNYDKITSYMNNSSNPLNVYSFLEHELKNVNSKRMMEWIPYSQINILEEVAKGGFGTISKAIWLNKTPVAVKRFTNSKDISKYFLNEVKSLHRCYNTVFIVKYYGITQHPETRDCMLIMKYASGGNLHNYLNKNFKNIKWITKLAILCQISDGLKTIHNEHFMHRDFHSGNILLVKDDHKKWVIGDLGLSQPANNSSNNEIYGVVFYIAPEIFQGAAFSKESDTIYIHSDPSMRPTITEIKDTVDDWYKKRKKTDRIFTKAEEKRSGLIESKQLGPEFSKEQYPGAIYTSRSLTPLISQVSSIRSSVGYITRELDFNI
ncbi:kinase-like domain-containing protein [Rhizophagus clarus]|uniref:Kinase-like domain-containing protein n=1 Tax=Rhizophagus clarus TaxID=94130 RepID=A0A8H3QUU2_9GLOM|nr:kinase-like domain-containing protein [Rhizophagus clarus]